MAILEKYGGIPPPGEYPTFSLHEGVVTLTLAKDDVLEELEIGRPFEYGRHGTFTLAHVTNSIGVMDVKFPGDTENYLVALTSHEITTIIKRYVHRTS